MSEQAFPDRHLLVLEAGRAERHYWRDLWAYRELFAILAWRDVAVRYKQTVIGIAWAVVRPRACSSRTRDSSRSARIGKLYQQNMTQGVMNRQPHSFS